MNCCRDECAQEVPVKKLVGVALSLLVTVPAAAGGVYKWTDEHGQVHFGDRPPAGTPAEHAEPRPATGVDPAAGSGLRSGERARLSGIEKQERLKATEKKRQDKRAAADEGRREHQVEQEVSRCVSYQQKIRDYKSRLRAGCRASTCNSYNEQLARYKSKTALVCR